MANALETTKQGKSVLRVGSEEIRTVSWPLSNSPTTVIYHCEALEQHTALLPSLARTVTSSTAMVLLSLPVSL